MDTQKPNWKFADLLFQWYVTGVGNSDKNYYERYKRSMIFHNSLWRVTVHDIDILKVLLQGETYEQNIPKINFDPLF